MGWRVVTLLTGWTLAASASADTQHTHDELNRLTRVQDAAGRSHQFEHDAAGNLVRVRTVGAAVPTNCQAAPARVVFSETFTAAAIDPLRWSVLNEGAGTLSVAGGVLSAAGSGASFPTLLTRTNPFSEGGNFSLVCRVRYTQFSNDWGNYACAATHLLTSNNGDGSTALGVSGGDQLYAFMSRYGPMNPAPPGLVRAQGQDSAWHEFEFCVVGDDLTTYRDGVLMDTTRFAAGWPRPTGIWIGSLFSPGTPRPWAGFELDVVQVRALD